MSYSARPRNFICARSRIQDTTRHARFATKRLLIIIMTGIKRRVDAAQDGERKRSKVKKQQNGTAVTSKTKSSKNELKQPKSALKGKEKKIIVREQSDNEDMPDVEDSEMDEFSGVEDMDAEEDISPKEKKGDINTSAPANKSKPRILVLT